MKSTLFVRATLDLECMHPLVTHVECLFLPHLESLAADLRLRFPSFQFNVWQGPVGSMTEYQGYALVWSASFPRLVPV